MSAPTTPSPARSGGLSYSQLLDADSRAVPDVLRRQQPLADAPVRVPIERYISPAFHQLEVERLWRRVWQMACHVDDLPAVGDHVVYDIASHSILLTRSAPDRIQAFHNVCLHRGRRLKDGAGCGQELRCPFHGFAWNLDGSLKHIPSRWDFPQVQDSELRLPEVSVATWGGFVFINMDPACEPFEQFVGPELTDQFRRWPLEQRFKQAHVAKVLSCNWKVAQEAFSEAYHVVATHPQMLAGTGDANSQYDAWGNFSRAITANGTPSPHLRWQPTEQDVLDAVLDRSLDQPPLATVADGQTARQVGGELRRRAMVRTLGPDADRYTDAELLDSFYYTLFPNFHPWGAFNKIVYRFRPLGDDVDRCIMECLYLAPYSGERPPAAKVHWLEEDQDWTDAPELGLLARVFNQDSFNLGQVQRGLHAAVHRDVIFANYQETKVRHFHGLLGQWLARP